MKDLFKNHFAATICFLGVGFAAVLITVTLLLDGTFAELAANLPF